MNNEKGDGGVEEVRPKYGINAVWIDVRNKVVDDAKTTVCSK